VASRSPELRSPVSPWSAPGHRETPRSDSGLDPVLRHRDPKLTEATDGHLATDSLRTEIDRLQLEGLPAHSGERSPRV